MTQHKKEVISGMWQRGSGWGGRRLSSKLRISAAIALASFILFGSQLAAAASDPLTIELYIFHDTKTNRLASNKLQ